MDLVHASRIALAEALLAAGPDAPTLCEGWRSRHLAAHLVLRENSWLSAGTVIGPLSGRLEKKIDQLAESARRPESYTALVRRFRLGPAKLSPFSLPAVADAANISEFFVHTEDVRRARAQWTPRVLDADYERILWRSLTRQGSLLYRKAKFGVMLALPDGRRFAARKGDNAVVITGTVSELMLHAYGRTSKSLATFEGSEAGLRAVQGFTPGL
ncbi:TIGR03085 family metal-binding protein [Glutamicibacter sp. PS]|uniref:TIGR03085 family metal-binding protein n=1 Tax=Glutamicibacter sp. PS TaxID=3075634 RepID=UPI00283E371C|nr:TIGR03085 family metal-binding protein [Glutamicibacter sp. PS]MDR4532508.1 TIGR03085 family metal-binding protein [Glutamicibacter sp. PS]